MKEKKSYKDIRYEICSEEETIYGKITEVVGRVWEHYKTCANTNLE